MRRGRPCKRHRGDRDVRLLWTATACLSGAFWMLQISVALHVLAVAGTAALAAVQLAGVLPALLLTPVAGLAADRMRLRPLLLWAVTAQTAAVAAMAVAAAAGSIAALAACYAAQSFAMAFWPAARQQWLYGLVAPESRQRANAAFGSIGGIMTIVGAIAAGLVSAWSPVAAIGGSAALMAGGAVLMAGVRETAPVKAAATSERLHTRVRAFAAGLREGFGATRRYPLARSVIWIGIAWGFIGGGYSVMLSGHVVEGLGGDAATVAAVFVCDGLAVLAGTVLAGRLRRSAHLPIWAFCYAVQGLAWAGFFAAPGLAGAVSCLAVMRLASGIIIALDTTILLETVPAEFRGRVTSIHVTTYSATARLSLAVLGAALGWAALTTLGITAGLLATATGIAWWLFAGRRAQAAYREAAIDPALPRPAAPRWPSKTRTAHRLVSQGPWPSDTGTHCGSSTGLDVRAMQADGQRLMS
ncbi:MFS transporter [Glycomyces sp. NPDC021274]|uniref:MFS transporter n=1 Tax=Glycomyces sp. NPDC021274 TaxID=3155120 RepID=UPI0033CBE4DE